MTRGRAEVEITWDTVRLWLRRSPVSYNYNILCQGRLRIVSFSRFCVTLFCEIIGKLS